MCTWKSPRYEGAELLHIYHLYSDGNHREPGVEEGSAEQGKSLDSTLHTTPARQNLKETPHDATVRNQQFETP